MGGGEGATNVNDEKDGAGVHEQGGEDVFFVDGTGRVTADGGLETGPIGSLVAKGGLVSEGATVLERKRAVRDGADPGGDGEGGGVEVDANLGTFFEVPDDGREGSANVLRIKVWSRLGGCVLGFWVCCPQSSRCCWLWRVLFEPCALHN